MPSSEVPEAAGPHIVHLVGRLTEQEFGFLRPATLAMVDRSAGQTVILFDDPKLLPWARRFDPSVTLLAPGEGAVGAISRWLGVMAAFRQIVEHQEVQVVHLHGFVPWLLGGAVLRKRGAQVRVYYTPHGSRSLGLFKPLGLVLHRTLTGAFVPRHIASVAAEAITLSQLTSQPAELIEHEVPGEFFAIPRSNIAERPLVVTGGGRGRERRSVHLISQWAVLLNSDDLHVSFNWMGTLDETGQARLRAANIGYVHAATTEVLASRLAQAWIYVQASDDLGFPLFLAYAMAVGLPCVVTDTPHHRDLINHGENGFLCQTREQMLRCIALLIDDAGLRNRIGRAARADALRRFAGGRFRDSLMQAYGVPRDSRGPERVDGVPDLLPAATRPAC